MSLTTLAAAAAALVFTGSRVLADAPSTPPSVSAAELLDLLDDPSLPGQVRGWMLSGGPDGEQVYCLHDLLVQRMTTGEGVRNSVVSVVEREGHAASIRALQDLGERCRAQGHDGAATWCADSVLALHRPPLPAGRRLASVSMH